uniref:PWWP domain-containing protein n=1 Tax=Leersia perrieri TaxID=77586 RepID=A0A0D9V208_9ORYZ
MGSCAGADGESPGGVTGADAEVGALVWVRRRNGSWWPGRILGPGELPENCVVPPRSSGTPIKLLGRPDGNIDWYNLEKSKRVKPFRCGEYEECIEKAKAQARHHKRVYSEGKYVRREDAIMHALEIERARFPNEDGTMDHDTSDSVYISQNSYCEKSKNINELNKRSSRTARDLYDIEEESTKDMSQALTLYKRSQNVSSSSTRYASSSKRKHKGSNDFEDDTVQGSGRMRDLREIGSKKNPKQSAYALNGHRDLPLLESASFGYSLSGTNGIKGDQQSHSSTKRKRSNIGQAYENSRKKNRRRPLSKLCKDSAVAVPSGDSSAQYSGGKMSDVFEPTRGEFGLPLDVNNYSYSSGTSSVDTLLDASCTNHDSAVKAFPVKEAEISCIPGFLTDDCSDDDEYLDTPLVMEDDGLEEGHLHKYGSCASAKGQISKPRKQTAEYPEVGIPSPHDHRGSKKKVISSVNQRAQEIHKDKNVLAPHGRTIKRQALYSDAVEVDARVRSAFCKLPYELDNSMQLAVVPADGCAEQQYYGSGPEHDESSETISNRSQSEKGAPSSPYYGLPLQVIPPEQKPGMEPSSFHVVKPIKSERTDYKLYDVELAVQGSCKGHRVPLVSLMSKWNGKPIVGYPIPVEVLEDSSVASRGDLRQATSSLNHLLKRIEPAEPWQTRSSHASRPKPSGKKKVSEHDMGKSWRPHTKKSASSPRKMRRLSSFASSRRDSASRKAIVGKIGGSTIACIPLRLVFSRINEALSFPVRSENPT